MRLSHKYLLTCGHLLRPSRTRSLCKLPPRFVQNPRFRHTPAEDPYFQSIVDNPPSIVKSGQKHGPGLVVLSKIYTLFQFSQVSHISQS